MKTRSVVYLAVLFVVSLAMPATLRGQSNGLEDSRVLPNIPVDNFTNLMNRLYSHSFTSNSALYVVDPTNGMTTLMGYTDVGYITDIAFSANNFLYGITFTALYHLDPYSAEGTYIGSTGFSNLNGLVTSPEGIIYAANTSYGQFIRIDENTGRGTLIGEFGTGLSSSGDMIFADDGTLYATLNRSGFANAWLATVDPDTGVATLIGDIGFGDVWGLSIRDGIMYGVTPSGQLLEIDPASGAGTLLGTDAGIAHGGLTTTPNLPLMDLPIAYDAEDFVDFLAGNNGIGDGRVNSWFDHNIPHPWGDTNQHLLRWTGYPEIATPGGNCQYGVSCYDNHEGIDFSRDPDQMPENIYAAAPGIVTDIVNICEVGERWCGDGYGNYVRIDHGNGYATLYAHLDDVFADEGDELYQTNFRDNPLGTMGATGNVSGPTGIHLHFGVYYDPNEGWTRGYTLDPYGWWDSDEDDPWTNAAQQQSEPMWKKPFSAQAIVDNNDYLLSSPSDQAAAHFSAGTFTVPTLVQLIDTSPVAPNPSDLHSVGTSFRLTASPVALQQQAPVVPHATSDQFDQPVTLQAAYGSSVAERLDVTTLSLYRWNEGAQSWEPLPSTVDPNLRVVTAQTLNAGEFDLKGVLACLDDPNEPNDSTYHSAQLNSGVVGGVFDVAHDADWYWLQTVAGGEYTVEILDLANGVDPYVELYDVTGTNMIASDDNSGPGDGFRLSWTAPANTTYFVRVSANSTSYVGCDATYEMQTTATMYVLLPVIQKP